MKASLISDHSASSDSRSASESAVIQAVREIAFGVVEVIVHDRRITEIRQTRRTRIEENRSI